MVGDMNDPEMNHGSSSLPAGFGSLDSAMSFDPFLNVDASTSLVDWTTIGLGEPLERSVSSASNYGTSIGMDGLSSGMSLVSPKLNITIDGDNKYANVSFSSRIDHHMRR